VPRWDEIDAAGAEQRLGDLGLAPVGSAETDITALVLLLAMCENSDGDVHSIRRSQKVLL
jgi:hypothetical protein